jgi:hypothetical protein
MFTEMYKGNLTGVSSDRISDCSSGASINSFFACCLFINQTPFIIKGCSCDSYNDSSFRL